MSATVVTDLAASRRNGLAYWEALRARALVMLGLDPAALAAGLPSQALFWPATVYAKERRSLTAEAVAGLATAEAALFSDFQLREPQRLLELLPALQPSLEFPLTPAASIPATLTPTLGQAVELIDARWPEAGRELRALVRAVAWFTDETKISYSAPRAFGLIFLNSGSRQHEAPAELATSLIHEAGHHALFVETAIDKLIPADFGKQVYSPLRGSQRPAIGALHALMAMARMLQWAERLADGTGAGDAAPAAESRRLFDKLVPAFNEGLKSLEPVGFSERGRLLMDEFRALARGWNGRR